MGLRILVVDDVADARDSMKLLLELDGHEVELATNGLEAIDAAKQHHHDVIFMDIAMPVMDGLTATRHLRRQPETQAVPVVAISAFTNDPRWQERATEAGMTDFLSKPLDYEKLESLLSRFTRH